MKSITFRATAIVLGGLLLGGHDAIAQDNNLARSYVVYPKDGMVAQFEAAVREHVAWRTANNDPWVWTGYSAETGPDLGGYVFRSSGHSWAEFDDYDQSFGMQAGMHWNATVAPLVKTAASEIDASDRENSRIPADGGPLPAFVTVTTFHLKPGMEQQFSETTRQVSQILIAKMWPQHWVWAAPVSGGPTGPAVYLAGLHTSWADMAEPDPSFESIVAGELGQDGFADWVAKFSETLRGTEVRTLRFRPDLSVLPN